MPIPPRPIPASNYHSRHRRNGRDARWRSPPLSGASGAELVAESRAEMALLPPMTLSAGSTPNTHSHSLRGVRLLHMNTMNAMHSQPNAIVGSAPTRPGTPPSPFLHAPASTPSAAHEVSLAALMDGRGRPKRVGTASQLGFDFVPRPAVVALSEDSSTPAPPPSAPRPVDAPRAFPWPWAGAGPGASAVSQSLPVESSTSKSKANLPAAAPQTGTAGTAGTTGTAAAGSSVPPGTPALVPSHHGKRGADDDMVGYADDDADNSDSDDDWEHVCAVEDDHIVGELELEMEDEAELGGGGGKGHGAQSTYATVAAVPQRH